MNPHIPKSFGATNPTTSTPSFTRKSKFANYHAINPATVGNDQTEVDERPKARNFYDVYTPNEINADITQYQIAIHSPTFESEQGGAQNGFLLEKNLKDMIETKDWFYENRYMQQKSGEKMTIATYNCSLIDDCFNHIDFVGIIKSQLTDSKPMPIGFDATCNTDYTKLRNKFLKRHAYGIRNDAPAEYASEFGSYDNSTEYTTLHNRYRYGIKLPGFGSVKYFEDTKHPDNPLIEKGRIEIMPRLIIGYDPEIAKVLDNGIDIKKLQSVNKMEQKHIMTKYTRAMLKAKWCTLLECHEQVDGIMFMLNNNLDEDYRNRRQEELKVAKEQIENLKKYVDFALEQANEAAKISDEERYARDYAMNEDIVQKQIKKLSKDVYINNTWQSPKTVETIGRDVINVYAEENNNAVDAYINKLMHP